MIWMWKVLKAVLWLVVAVVALFLLNIAYFRWRGPSEAQKAALARVEAGTPEPAGRNAFAWMLLFNKDIPDEAIEATAREDVKFALDHAHLASAIDEIPSSRLPSLAEPKPDSAALCQMQEPGCLARVRMDPQATRNVLTAHARLVARAAQLEDFDFLRSEFQPLAGMPIAYRASAQRLRLTALALAHVDGQREQALAGTCRNLAAWRRFGRDNPSLIYSMIAINQRDAALHLLAEMLARQEPGDAIPAECHAALAPVAADEVSLCAPMIGEFDFMEASLKQMQQPETGAGADRETSTSDDRALLADAQYRYWRAENATAWCASAAQQAALEDHLLEQTEPAVGPLECASNPVACILIRIAAPVYPDYQARLLDAAAHLRLAATLLWLKEAGADKRELATRFGQRPDSLRSGSRASGISDDGRLLWVDNLYRQRGERFELELAPAPEAAP
ncbi:hypothetical protein [Dokdonella immobilis]|uniref:Uncharacterized protein n=1 Tax=Dokdonella immobilis TaxID=578942 RepID=A0A1I4ZS52_9GAMM|nr:hypothetical protein [Dokdonella immobilis]SFN52820.1 hypothetical protein SAMN05216289_12821 [Dokdonella immobilis]